MPDPSPLPEPAPATLGARVTEAIVGMIAAGELVPGQRLVEPVIARALGVGTVPVREALRILAGDGVVDLIPNRGARLRAMTPREVDDTLKGVTGLLLAAIDMLEGRPLGDIARRLAPIAEEIAIAQAAGDGATLFEASGAFQRQFLHAADNGYILRIVGRVHFGNYIRQLLRFVAPSQLPDLPDHYRAITAATAAGDIPEIKKLFVENQRMVSRILATL